jgi:hypothetical protein
MPVTKVSWNIALARRQEDFALCGGICGSTR